MMGAQRMNFYKIFVGIDQTFGIFNMNQTVTLLSQAACRNTKEGREKD